MRTAKGNQLQPIQTALWILTSFTHAGRQSSWLIFILDIRCGWCGLWEEKSPVIVCEFLPNLLTVEHHYCRRLLQRGSSMDITLLSHRRTCFVIVRPSIIRISQLRINRDWVKSRIGLENQTTSFPYLNPFSNGNKNVSLSPGRQWSSLKLSIIPAKAAN